MEFYFKLELFLFGVLALCFIVNILAINCLNQPKQTPHVPPSSIMLLPLPVDHFGNVT